MASSSYVILVVVCSLFGYGSSSLVKVNDNGGYRNLVVAVSSDLTNVEAVLDRFKTLIQDASKALHFATRQRFYFEEVIFLLPASSGITSHVLEDRRRSWMNPDIVLIEDNGNRTDAFTIQHDGCGRPGSRIYVPRIFLTRDNAHKGLVHKWAHYRYGLFDEHGYQDDPVYPIKYRIPGTENQAPISVTSCTNEKAQYKFLNSSGHLCSPSAADCLPVFEDSQNPNVVSSLMDQRLSSKVSHFCDGSIYAHNRDAPSMQNSLCREKSSWQVLNENVEFQSRQPRELTPTLFRYVLESSARVVFVIEATKNLAKNNRIDSVKNAFSFFALYDLPQSSKMWMINLRRLGPPYHNAELTFESLLDFFPEAYEDVNVCIHCGLNEATNVLSQNAMVHADGYIILVTSVDIQQNQLEQVARNLQDNHVKLFVIFFGDPSQLPPILQQLSNRSGGKLFYILEDSKKNQMTVPLTQLYESFRYIYGSFSWRNRNRLLIEHQVFYDYTQDGKLPFTIDDSIDSFQVIVTGPDFLSGPPVLREKLLLKLNNQEYDVHFAYRMKIPAYILTVSQAKAGTWELHFHRKKDNTQSIVIIIRAFTSDFNKIVSVRLWLSSPSTQTVVPRPQTLYAEIRKGHNPVGDSSNVTAILQHHSTGEETFFQLLDSGEGEPDIRQNDGIYTRCLTGNLQNGYYTMTVVARKQITLQKKSRGFGLPLTEVNAFSRITIFGSFYFKSEGKKFGPRRIVDLHVSNVQSLKHGIKHYTLKWTAPGDDYDSGQASKYEMRVFRDRDDALNNFDTKYILTISEWETHGPWLKPEVAGTTQNLIIQLNLTTGLYYIAMRAVDQYDNKADVSNIVQLYFERPLITGLSTNWITSFTYPTGPPGNESVGPSSVDFETQPKGSKNLNIVIGVTCGLLFFLLVIAFFLLVYLSNRRRRKRPKKDTISPPYFPRKHSETSEAICSGSMKDQPLTNPAENLGFVTDFSHQGRTHFTNNFVIPTISRNLQDNSSVASINDSIIYSTMRSVHTRGSLLDVGNFYEVPLHEDRNLPFNPAYTSSLRRMPSQKSQTYHLGTDV